MFENQECINREVHISDTEFRAREVEVQRVSVDILKNEITSVEKLNETNMSRNAESDLNGKTGVETIGGNTYNLVICSDDTQQHAITQTQGL